MVAGCLDELTQSPTAINVSDLAGASRDSQSCFLNKALGLNTVDKLKHFVKLFMMETELFSFNYKKVMSLLLS